MKHGHRKPCLPSLYGVALPEGKLAHFKWRFANRLPRHQCWPGIVRLTHDLRICTQLRNDDSSRHRLVSPHQNRPRQNVLIGVPEHNVPHQHLIDGKGIRYEHQPAENLTVLCATLSHAHKTAKCKTSETSQQVTFCREGHRLIRMEGTVPCARIFERRAM